jgi:hypothetical protein
MLIMQITKRLGSSTPFIISIANGIIGRDALNNEFREVYIFLSSSFFWVLFIGKLSFLGEAVTEE